MPATKRGIYHNLKESKYTISNTEIVFFFSSELYLTKFMDGYKEHREKFIERFESLYPQKIATPLNMTTLADITLYKSIEKRGFRSCLKGVDITWEDLHQYALRKMSQNSSIEWERIERPNLKERIGEMNG